MEKEAFHKILGPVVITEACEMLQKKNPDPFTMFVELKGEAIEVSKSLVVITEEK